MRHLWSGFALLAVVHAADAQMPPSIRKPIEAARRSVEATNAQSGAVTPARTPARTPAKQVPPKATAKPMAVASRGAAAPPALATDSSTVTFDREVFTYVSSGRRDPFSSPFETGEIRPLIADLRIAGIIFDLTGRNSVAVLRDKTTQEQYRVKTGQMLGRARVAQIRQQEVVMTIDEYGFSRQEILKLSLQQTKGKP